MAGSYYRDVGTARGGIMKRLKLLIASLLVFGAVLLPTTAQYAQAAAVDPLESACSTSEAASSPNCAAYLANKGKDASNPLVGADGLLTKITKVVAIIAGVAGILVVVIGGFNYITSAGDAQKSKKARDMIIGALIGLAIIVLAQTIITFVLKKL